MDIIIIHGAPGTGKTTIAGELHRRWGSPWFEFGWIPEFRNKNPHTLCTQREEEQLSFENLVLVCKNYLSHGFENILLTDLNDARMLDVPSVFNGINWMMATLYVRNDNVIKERILTRKNGNEYRNDQEAVRLNHMIQDRKVLPNEYRISTDQDSPAGIAQQIEALTAGHRHNPIFNRADHTPANYFSYIKGYSDESSQDESADPDIRPLG